MNREREGLVSCPREAFVTDSQGGFAAPMLHFRVLCSREGMRAHITYFINQDRQHPSSHDREVSSSLHSHTRTSSQVSPTNIAISSCGFPFQAVRLIFFNSHFFSCLFTYHWCSCIGLLPMKWSPKLHLNSYLEIQEHPEKTLLQEETTLPLITKGDDPRAPDWTRTDDSSQCAF